MASTVTMSKSSALSRGNVSKKSRPKIGTKSKVIKFHQYLGPKNPQQQLEPCSSGTSGSTSTADTPFNILVQQQQMLLRWQLEFQQKNMQFLLSMPSNEPPKPAAPKLAISTPPPQPTSTDIATKPLVSVAAVSPELAAKRMQLEEMKVAVLRDECRRLNLARSGPKPALVDRLLPYADDVLSGSSSATATESESKPLEQFVTSPSAVPALGVSNNDASSAATNIMFSMPPRMMTSENGIVNSAASTPAVPMDVDGVSCKQEPTTPDVAQPHVYPMMFVPASSGGNIVQASVSSAVPPLIVFRPSAQPVMRLPAAVPKPIESMPPPSLQPSIPPSLQQQILLEQQRHISELEHHLKLSRQELARAQFEAQVQQILRSGGCDTSSLYMNNAALNGSSMSASMSSINPQATAPQLLRTNR